jgi:hypothetical protein
MHIATGCIELLQTCCMALTIKGSSYSHETQQEQRSNKQFHHMRFAKERAELTFCVGQQTVGEIIVGIIRLPPAATPRAPALHQHSSR